MDFCTDYNILNAFSILTRIFNLVCIIMPVILVILTMITIFKVVTSNDDEAFKKIVSISLKRFIACVVIIFLPTFGKVIMQAINDATSRNFDLYSCFNNAQNLEYYEQLYMLQQAKEVEAQKAEINSPQRTTVTSNPPVAEIKKTTESNLEESKTVPGKSFALTEKEIIQLACIIEHENDGALEVEATVLVNLYNENNKGRFSSPAQYATNEWFSTGEGCKSATTASQKAINVVKSVIVDGESKFPSYVNEHVTISYIDFIVVNGKKITDRNAILDHSNYIKDNTIIYEKGKKDQYDRGWYFYSFPCERCDPFGYYVQQSTGNRAPRYFDMYEA